MKNVQNTLFDLESRGWDLVARLSDCSVDEFPELEAEFKALKLGATSGDVLRAWVRARSDLLYSPQFLWWMGEARAALEEGDWEQAASRLDKARELAPCSRRLARMSAWCFTVIIYSGIGESGDETLPQRRDMAIHVRDEVIPWLSVPSRILSDLLRGWSLLWGTEDILAETVLGLGPDFLLPEDYEIPELEDEDFVMPSLLEDVFTAMIRSQTQINVSLFGEMPLEELGLPKAIETWMARMQPFLPKDARHYLAVSLSLTDSPEEKGEVLREHLRFHPGNGDAWEQFGDHLRQEDSGRACAAYCQAALLESPDRDVYQSLNLHRKLYRAFVRAEEQEAAEKECLLMAVLLSGEVEKEEFDPFTDLVRREGLAKARKSNRSVYHEKALDVCVG